jgi:hypothetical protein
VPKFILNLHVQISKALVNSKIQFLFQKDFFSTSSPIGASTSQPIWPFWPTWPHWPPSSSFTCAGQVSPPPHMLPHQGRHAALCPRHEVDPTHQARHYPTPSTQPHFLPLLHSGNGSIVDAIYYRGPTYPSCRTRFLCQNQVLIVCMTQDQLFHTYGQKVFTDN